MKLCVITLIISYSLLSGCNSSKTVTNTNQHEIAASTPLQIQKITPQNPTSVEPTETKKERALREILSEATTYQHTHTLNTNNPEELFILYTNKIINNWTIHKADGNIPVTFPSPISLMNCLGFTGSAIYS